jgi:hypothetical protein
VTDQHQRFWERISFIELAEIKTLLLIKDVHPQHLHSVLDSKGVEALEQLDTLTARNFLHYLRSL